MYFYWDKNDICIRDGGHSDVELRPTVCGVHRSHDRLAAVTVAVAITAVVLALITTAAAVHGVVLAAIRAAVQVLAVWAVRALHAVVPIITRGVDRNDTGRWGQRMYVLTDAVHSAWVVVLGRFLRIHAEPAR